MILYHSQQLRCGNQRQSRPVTALPSSSSYAQSVVSPNFTLSSSDTNGLSTASSIFDHKPWRRVQDECVFKSVQGALSRYLPSGGETSWHLAYMGEPCTGSRNRRSGGRLFWSGMHRRASARCAIYPTNTTSPFVFGQTASVAFSRACSALPSLPRLLQSTLRILSIMPTHAYTFYTALLRVEKKFITRTIALVGLRPLATSLGIIS